MLHGRDAGVITCKSSMIQRHSVVLFGTYPGAKSRIVGSPLCLGSFSVADVAGCMTTQVLLKYLQAVAACAATDIPDVCYVDLSPGSLSTAQQYKDFGPMETYDYGELPRIRTGSPHLPAITKSSRNCNSVARRVELSHNCTLPRAAWNILFLCSSVLYPRRLSRHTGSPSKIACFKNANSFRC